MRTIKRLILVALCLFTIDRVMIAQKGGGERWIGTWSTSEVGRPQTPPPPAPVLLPLGPNQCPPPAPAPSTFVHFKDQTLRQIVHTSIGGANLRVVLSNKYGTAPLTIGAAHISLREKESSIRTASGHPLTFNGKPATTIPA